MNKHVFFITIFCFLLTGCANHYDSASLYEPYGFFSGVLHGLLFPIELLAVIVSWVLSNFEIQLFTEVTLIGQPNTGWSYGIGYFFGLLLIDNVY